MQGCRRILGVLSRTLPRQFGELTTLADTKSRLVGNYCFLPEVPRRILIFRGGRVNGAPRNPRPCTLNLKLLHATSQSRASASSTRRTTPLNWKQLVSWEDPFRGIMGYTREMERKRAITKNSPKGHILHTFSVPKP